MLNLMDPQSMQSRPSADGRDTLGRHASATEAAGRRILAYLRLLPMAEERRLELTLEILRDLAPIDQAGEQAPARAMTQLRERLREQETQSAPHAAVHPAQPVLMRGHMVPEEMDRRPWLTQAVRLAQGYGRLANRLPVLKPRVIWPLLLAVLIFMHLLARKLS